MKQNVIKEYIWNALVVTADDYIFKTVNGLSATLKWSSYPKNFFNIYVNYITDALRNLSTLHVSSVVWCWNNTIDCNDELFVRWVGTSLDANIVYDREFGCRKDT